MKLTVNKNGLALIEKVNKFYDNATELGVFINDDDHDVDSLIFIGNCLSYIVSTEDGIDSDEFFEKVGMELDERYLPYLDH
jgi:hypothetical protein